MAKLVNILSGALIFIGLVVFTFGFFADLTNEYSAQGSGNYTALAGEYNQIDDIAGSNSAIRAMDNQTQFGDTAEQDVSSFFISGGLGATRLITNIGPSINSIIELSQSDTATFINPIVTAVILAIIAVILIIIVIGMIMRKNPDT